jgi:sialate O-acetylesterase
MKKSITLRAAALLAMVSLSTTGQPAAAAEAAELIHHYTLDGTLGDEVSTLVLQPSPDSPVHYVEDAPSGRAKSVLFGSDTEKETSRLIFPLAVKLPSDAGTVSMWVKAPGYTMSAEGARYILNAPGQEGAGYEPGKTAGCYIILRGLEGSIGCTLGGSELMQGGFPDLSEWTHLAITWSDERKSARLYLNGEQAAEVDIVSGPTQSEVHPIRIGGFATTPDIDPTETQFQGMLGDLRIYEGELSEAEIAKMCAITKGTTETPATKLAAARIFSSHMVLQRDHPVPVWGTGAEGTTVEVDFAGQKKSATVADGRWEVVLDPIPASTEGRSLVLTSGEKKITFKDILVGDVWLASGQSNMQMALGSTVGGEEAISGSGDSLLRFNITPMKLGPEAPSIPVQWQVATADTTARLTAVGYHFARELRQTTGIPIGIVQCAYGGSRAESWSSPELMSRGWPGYENFVKNQPPEHLEKHPQVVASTCYESMLRPLIPFAFRGTIWYQGEGNSGTPEEHKTLLPALIGEFREQFRRADMPFYFVQLARLEKADWSAIRRAQLHIWENTPNTFMAVSIDLPKTFNANDDPIHPDVKQPIGERLARAARHFIYGEHDLLPSGPRFKDAVSSEGKTVLGFDYAGGGLATLDEQPLRGLYAGPVGGPIKAVDAEMHVDKLVIDHAAHGLSLPLLIRYGSEEDMGKETLDVNLGNSEKLPASPFMVRVSAD